MGKRNKKSRKINDGHALAKKLLKINDADRLALARQHQAVIQSGLGLFAVLSKLLPEQRLGFALENKFAVTPDFDLLPVLGALQPEERYTFVMANDLHTDKGDGLYLTNMLSELPAHQRMSVMLKFQHMVRSSYDFQKVSTTLEGKDKLTAADACFPVIKPESHSPQLGAGYALARIVGRLDPEDRLTFALKHRAVFTTHVGMQEVANLLPDAARTIFESATTPKALNELRAMQHRNHATMFQTPSVEPAAQVNDETATPAFR